MITPLPSTGASLLSPLSFAGLTLRNRIVEYHRLRAAAGTALVIVEHTYVHP